MTEPDDIHRPFVHAAYNSNGHGSIRVIFDDWSGGEHGNPAVSYLYVHEARAMAARLLELANEAERDLRPVRPLPLALRHDELTPAEFEALRRNAKDPDGPGRLTRTPRAVPTVPVAMRDDQISLADLAVLERAAKTTPDCVKRLRGRISESERDALFARAADPDATEGVLDWVPRKVGAASDLESGENPTNSAREST